MRHGSAPFKLPAIEVGEGRAKCNLDRLPWIILSNSTVKTVS